MILWKMCDIWLLINKVFSHNFIIFIQVVNDSRPLHYIVRKYLQTNKTHSYLHHYVSILSGLFFFKLKPFNMIWTKLADPYSYLDNVPFVSSSNSNILNRERNRLKMFYFLLCSVHNKYMFFSKMIQSSDERVWAYRQDLSVYHPIKYIFNHFVTMFKSEEM